MKAHLKCSSCGAEISNINLSWGRNQWLWFVPFMVLVFLLPFIINLMTKDKDDFRFDLIIKYTEKRYVNGTVDVLGIIENHGKVDWKHIVVKAELFGKGNTFIDVLTDQISSNLLPGTTEHFKISAKEFPEPRWEAIKDIKLKVADAHHSKY